MDCYNFNTLKRHKTSLFRHRTHNVTGAAAAAIAIYCSTTTTRAAAATRTKWILFSSIFQALSIFRIFSQYSTVCVSILHAFSSASMKRKPLPSAEWIEKKKSEYETITITKRKRDGDRWPLKRSNRDFSVWLTNEKEEEKSKTEHEHWTDQTKPKPAKQTHIFFEIKKNRRTTEHVFSNVNNYVCAW